MAARTLEWSGKRVFVLEADGAQIASERDAMDVIGESFGERAEVVAIPVGRLAAEFFKLATRLLGDVVQKFVNYRRRLVIVGDVDPYIKRSAPFADFVREANRGPDIWFVKDLNELEERLRAEAS